ncbi:unnamed protein product [Mytilus coruscus]|uniref:C2H2-type domain-containing protein n=1 Tax=Mytilus coruscus TaxID=42192 RepID=A0A6J8DVR2_MYTCO|nr:unnamed protein product [Mytilus coruscus]
MEEKDFICNLCPFSTNEFRKFSSHYVRFHKNDPNFSVSCGVGRCEFTTRRWNTYKVHVHRNHKIEAIEPAQQNDNNLEFDPENSIPFDNIDDLRHQNALFTMSLEAKYNVSQIAIDNIVSSTSILLDAQLHHFKQLIVQELELRNINTEFVDHINIDHMLHDFDTSKNRYSVYEKCDNLPFVRPEEVVLGVHHMTTNNIITEEQRVGYYVPFIKSLNMLLDLPEIWNFVKNPHNSKNQFLYDICDGDLIKNNPLFQQNKKAIQVVLNTDDLEIVNPLGSHLVAIAKTSDVREQGGVEKILDDFITSMNYLSNDGVEMIINDTLENIQGALVLAPCDTLAANWLGKFKEGVAFALKNCRLCDTLGSDIKNKALDHECIMRTDQRHAEQCDFLDQVSKGTRKYWSKMWGINKREK